MIGLRDKPVGRSRPGTIKDDPFSPFPNPVSSNRPARPGPVCYRPIS